MVAFKHILVPLDFGSTSAHALDYAIEIATKLGSEITLVHAYTLPSTAYGYGESLSWPSDHLTAAAQKTLDVAYEKARAKYPKMQRVLASGEPSLQILETAKEHGCDLIVMGTHGRRGITRAILGSVAEKVVRLSPVPVLTVASEHAEHAAHP